MACQGVRCCLMVLSVFLFAGCAAEHDRFHYDYMRLRMGGLIFAGVMLTIGVIVLLTDFNLLKKKKKEPCKLQAEI